MKTKIKVTPYNGKSNTKAFVDLELDGHFIVKGLTLVEGKRGLFLSFPSKKGKDNKYYNLVYTTDKEYRENLESACIKKYNDVVSKDRNEGDFD